MRKFLFLTLIILSGSCEEPIEVDLPPSSNNIIINGWITDEKISYEVRITRTNAFDDKASNPAVTGADVVVIDNHNNQYMFEEITPGIYRSDTSSFIGNVGDSYILNVGIGDKKYYSDPETLNTLPIIDSIFFESFVEPDPEDPANQLEFFFPVGVVNDPESIENFYRWVIYENDSLLSDPENLILISDQFIDGNIFQNELPDIILEAGDDLRIEQLSLSKPAFDYLSIIKNQLTSLGTSSGTAPVLVRGNIFNPEDEDELVLGFFGASSFSSIHKEVE
ncbi:MAG TPA: DUF4249 domain-containing protein [Cyclobacteriaceae bacterium]